MIQSFRHKGLRRYAEKGDRSKLSVQKIDRVNRVLSMLDGIRVPEDMDLPGWRFHELKGDNKGRYSVLLNRNWRLTFGWDGKDAIEVDMEDYH